MSRLYYDDSDLLAFDAMVTACDAAAEGGYRVTLDRSAFYPTSGGQLHDLGLLRVDGGSLPVSRVESDDTDAVWHYVPMPLAPGTAVHGEIEATRRFDFRQQHSGQHILSASFAALFDARTESVHLGLDACTLDLDREVTADQCDQAEAHASGIVWADRDVQIRYADAEALANEPRLRKMTGRTGRVRLVDITDHDLSACGGTHVRRTGQVGAIVIRATERFRGGTRVTFLCGRRVRDGYRGLRTTVDSVSRMLSVGADDVADAVGKVRDDLKQEQRRARALAERLTMLQVAALEAQVSVDGVIVAHLPDADAAGVRAAASQLVGRPGRVVGLLGGDAPHAIVVARSADRTDVDAGAIVRRVCEVHGGKGGGRPDLAQAGGVAATAEQLRLLLTTSR